MYWQILFNERTASTHLRLHTCLRKLLSTIMKSKLMMMMMITLIVQFVMRHFRKIWFCIIFYAIFVLTLQAWRPSIRLSVHLSVCNVSRSCNRKWKSAHDKIGRRLVYLQGKPTRVIYCSILRSWIVLNTDYKGRSKSFAIQCDTLNAEKI